MKVVRHPALQRAVKRIHDGPCPGGTFWTVPAADDLPDGPRAFADACQMLRHGRLWWQDAADAARTWVEIRDVSEVADLDRRARPMPADFDGVLVQYRDVHPELYFVPRNWRGNRLVERAHNRAFARAAGVIA